MSVEFGKQLQDQVEVMSPMERKKFVDQTPSHLRVNLQDPTVSWDNLLELAISTQALIIDKNAQIFTGIPSIPENTKTKFIEDYFRVVLTNSINTPQLQRKFIDSTETKLKLVLQDPTISFEDQIDLAIKTRVLLNERGTILS